MDAGKFDALLDRHQRDPACLLAILQDIQKEENHLPKVDLRKVAEELGVSLARVYSMATFFTSFSLAPRGRHTCTVCMGTACHVRGAPKLVEKLSRDLGIRAGETTPDRNVTLETVNCVGACALGPLVIVDGEYHGIMTSTKMDRIVDALRKR